MSNEMLPAALLLPVTLAAASAIFPFGKRKAESIPEPEAIRPEEPVTTQTEEGESDTDDTGETLPVLATFSLTDEQYDDRDACEQVWDALALPVRTEDTDAPTNFFALTAFDAAPEGHAAAALTACKLAQDAIQRGYSALLIDAHVARPSLHKLPLFAPREGAADTSPAGFADFLRGDTTRLEPLLKLAWRTEGLLLLPAGNVADGDETLTSGATWERLLRLAAPLAEIVIVVAPPLFAPEGYVRNQDVLPKMDGVLVAYPSSFSASGDTEALEKMEAMSVPQVGAIVAPPVSFQNNDGPEVFTQDDAIDTEADANNDPDQGVVYTSEVTETEIEPDAGSAEPFPEERPSVTEETVADTAAEPVEDAVAETETEAAPEEPVNPEEQPQIQPQATPVMQAAVPTGAARPSFLSPPAAASGVDKPRGDARRAVPIDNVPVYSSTPAHLSSRPGPTNTGLSQQQPSDAMPLNNTPISAPNAAYRPDVAIELLPSSGSPAQLALRADVGGVDGGPVLLLEVRTLAAEAKRLRADNPGTRTGATDAGPVLTLEALTSDAAPEDATTLRLVVRESSAEGAAVLLEAALETPDALRIKSGKASAAGVPPVRFEVTTEPDETARFRATIPPLEKSPALLVDLERTTTPEGRLSRIVLRIA